MSCPLCVPPEAEPILWRDARCRIVEAQDPDYPGYCRVVWHEHVREMSDLVERDRAHLMAVVFAVEAALREALQPEKMNLAALGNQIPHLHWHVIPRFRDDPHFPDAVWASRRRNGGNARHLEASSQARSLERRLGKSE